MHPHKYSHSSVQWTTLILSPATNRLSPLPAADISKRVVWLCSGCFWFLFFVMSPQHLAFAPSVSVFPHLPPKDTAVSGIRPGCGLVLAGQWAMQAFFPPAVGSWVEYLPSDVFCWAPFTHTTDCKWCSGLSPVDLEGDQIHHCPRRTLRRPDIHWFCHQKNPSARC